MSTINTNVKALSAQNALKLNDHALTTAMAQLSTGKRITSAGDDAVGIAMGSRMTQQIKSLDQAVRNAGDAISMIQTAEGATNEITSMLQRMRELSIQAMNETSAADQPTYATLVQGTAVPAGSVAALLANQMTINGFNLGAALADGVSSVQNTISGVAVANAINAISAQSKVSAVVGKTMVTGAPITAATTGGTGTNHAIADGDVKINGVSIGAIGAVATAPERGAQMAAAINALTPQTGVAATFSGTTGAVALEAADGRNITVSVKENAAAINGAVTGLATDGAVGGGANYTTATLRSAVKLTSTDGGGIAVGGNAVTVLAATGLTTAYTAATTTPGTAARGYLDLEFQQLKKEIVRIANNTEWNGFPILNGSAGQALGPVPVQRVAANNQYLGAIAYTAGAVSSGNAGAFTSGGSGALAKSGSLAITLGAAPNGTAVLTLNDGSRVNLALTYANKVISFTNTALTEGAGTFTLTTAGADWANTNSASLTIGRSFGALDAMRVNDVAINGVNLAASSALDDARSPAANAAASAIAKVASINATTAATGVSAVVGKTVLVGAAQSGVAAQVGTSTGTLSINGYVSSTITSIEGNPRASRAAVLDAINRMSSKTGVVAVDTGTDLTGVRLEAADGRNIEVAFNTESTAADFSARTGLKQGVQSATYSLQAKVETAINITAPSAGVIGRSGLQAGNFADNVAVVSGMARAPVQAATAQSQSVTLGGTVAVSDSFSITVNGKLKTFTATATNIENVRAGLIAAINADATLGVSAANGGSLNELQLAASVPGTAFTCVVSKSSAAGTLATAELVANAAAQSKPLQAGDLLINGVAIRATSASDDKLSNLTASGSDRLASGLAIAAAINAQSALTKVSAKANAVSTSGEVTTTALPVTGAQSLFINGVQVSITLTQHESASARRAAVIAAINLQGAQHGLAASDNGNGVTLSAADGRNVSVWFDSNVKDLSAASFGLGKAGAVAQVSTVVVGGTVASTDTATVVINGTSITSAQAGGTNTADLAGRLATAIQAKITDGSLKNISVALVGSTLTLSSTVAGSGFDLNGAAATNPAAAITLAKTSANSLGSNEVVGIRDALATSKGGMTLYGSVSLLASIPSAPPARVAGQPGPVMASTGEITVRAGSNGFGSGSNFSSIGLVEGQFGGKSAIPMSSPRIGRLSFQIGAGTGQDVSIDFEDFGSGGSVTGEITGDFSATVPLVRIDTTQSAGDVLAKLDRAMARVDAARANMGAVTNRLMHAVDNLTNVSINAARSRGQVLDADYAKASSDLARAQIIQQAGMAVLAQANTSQQSVLKLLGN